MLQEQNTGENCTIFLLGNYNLEIDWLDDPRNFTCYHPRNRFLPSKSRYAIRWRGEEGAVVFRLVPRFSLGLVRFIGMNNVEL